MYIPVKCDVLDSLVDDLDNNSIALACIDGGAWVLAVDGKDVLGAAEPGAWSLLYLQINYKLASI